MTGDDITIGELGRRFDAFAKDVKDRLDKFDDKVVTREVYKIDQQNTQARFKAIEDDQQAAESERRQMRFIMLGGLGTILAGVAAGFIQAGGHL